jgi:RNA 2',3'-cyclic 3'-phosphodiesterase
LGPVQPASGRSDNCSDPMKMMRCFLAVELPVLLQDAIRSAISDARGAIGTELVRWIPVQNIHLTLKFLGDTAPSSQVQIEAALRAEVPQYKPFTVELQGLGAFPSVKRARVLWIGLNAPASLASLQHELDVATRRLGYVSEEREFSPHLTIGRVRQNASTAHLQRIRDVLERTSMGRLGTLAVEAVHLYKSELLPSGSVYSKLCTVHLGGG